MTNLKELRINIEKFPEALHNTLKDAKIYDSSSSPEAQVLFIDKKDGYYLKIASSKTLEREAEMTAYFQKKKLGLGYISYLSDQSQDFLLKKKFKEKIIWLNNILIIRNVCVIILLKIYDFFMNKILRIVPY